MTQKYLWATREILPQRESALLFCSCKLDLQRKIIFGEMRPIILVLLLKRCNKFTLEDKQPAML